jgi:hypothetical protein
MTPASTSLAGPERDRPPWLVTCTGGGHRAAVADLLAPRVHSTAGEAAVEASTLAGNPFTDFDDSASVVACHLE